MPEYSETPTIDKGSDAWNVAQGYTHLKILKPLVELDKLVIIAQYGTENIENSFEIPQDVKTQYRIESIHRLIDCLKIIIENSDFAMKKETKDTLLQLEIRIVKVEKYMSVIARKVVDQRNGAEKIEINERHFNNCMNELRKIKKEIQDPLNKNSLIFPSSDEINLDDMKNKMIMGG